MVKLKSFSKKYSRWQESLIRVPLKPRKLNRGFPVRCLSSAVLTEHSLNCIQPDNVCNVCCLLVGWNSLSRWPRGAVRVCSDDYMLIIWFAQFHSCLRRDDAAKNFIWLIMFLGKWAGLSLSRSPSVSDPARLANCGLVAMAVTSSCYSMHYRDPLHTLSGIELK